MKITVVGCGNAFSKKQFNQCYMLEEDGRRLLIDFGAKVPYALDHLNIDIKTINDIYISHLHGDHVGGLEELAFLRYDWVRRPQHYSERHESMKAPCLIGNSQLLSDLWRKSLRGGLESMEGFDATIETYFQPMAIAPNKTFEWMGWECKLIQQVHIMTGSMISHTFGLFMTKEGHKSIYFTTDSQHCSPRQIEIFYKKSDIIFQDCECVGCDVVKKNSDFISGVHANYAQLAAWPSANSVDVGDDIRAKMFLSHYQDFVILGKDYKGQDCQWFQMAIDDGFKGFVCVGMEIEV